MEVRELCWFHLVVVDQEADQGRYSVQKGDLKVEKMHSVVVLPSSFVSHSSIVYILHEEKENKSLPLM